MWGLLTITGEKMVNYGNEIVEKSLLNNFVDPSISFSVFKKPRGYKIKKMNDCKYIICSGTTILTESQSKLFSWSKKLNKPIFTIGSCFWQEKNPDLRLVKNLKAEIGVRDSFSKNILEKHSVPHTYIGCPTLFLDLKSKKSNKKYDILFGFSRNRIDDQIKWLKKKKDKKRILGVVQEKYERKFVKKAGIEFVDLSKEQDIQDVLNAYRSAEICITGRLHVALPVITNETPIYFFGQKDDTRYSLLRDLDVKVNSFSDLKLLKDIENNATFSDSTTERIKEFKESYIDYLQRNFSKEYLKIN